MDRVRWYVDCHKSPVWLVPAKDGYLVVITEPKSEQLPSGTRAIQYGPELVELASVEARK